MLMRFVLIWGLILLLEAVVVVLVAPPSLVVNAAAKEEIALTESLGPEAAEEISVKAQETFNELFRDTGIMAESFSLLVPSETTKRRSSGIETLAEGMFEVVRRRLESAWNLVFVGIQRMYSFLAWLPLLIPFVIACAYDGATIRKVKLLTFGISSAPMYGAAMHGLVLLLFFPFFYALWPFGAPPLLVPLWFISLALVVRLLVANLHRM